MADIQKEVAKLELKITIGINSGNMYFGSIGSQEHLEISAYGPEIILAKRLQESAKGGQIFVGDGTYRHAKEAFDFKKVEGLKLKGLGEGLVAYEAIKVKSHPERIRGIEGLRAPLIGREGELEKLRTCIEEGKTELSWGRACHKCENLAKARVHLTCAAEIFESLGTNRYIEWTKEALAKLSNP